MKGWCRRRGAHPPMRTSVGPGAGGVITPDTRPPRGSPTAAGCLCPVRRMTSQDTGSAHSSQTLTTGTELLFLPFPQLNKQTEHLRLEKPEAHRRLRAGCVWTDPGSLVLGEQGLEARDRCDAFSAQRMGGLEPAPHTCDQHLLTLQCRQVRLSFTALDDHTTTGCALQECFSQSLVLCCAGRADSSASLE